MLSRIISLQSAPCTLFTKFKASECHIYDTSNKVKLKTRDTLREQESCSLFQCTSKICLTILRTGFPTVQQEGFTVKLLRSVSETSNKKHKLTKCTKEM